MSDQTKTALKKSVKPSTAAKAPGEKTWWAKGVRFQCQGSGQCCISRGEYGFVFLTLEDRRNMAQELGLTLAQFTRKYTTRLGPAYHLKEDPKRPECMFLDGNRCNVYKARPVQCRTWPFWPEVMGAKAWKKEVADYCPGVGKGPLRSAKDIATQMEMQKKAEDEISGRNRL